MQKKKVLMVSCTGLGNGGAQAVIMSIVRRLSFKYLFDIVCFNSDDYYKDEFESYGGKVFVVPVKNSRFDFYLRYNRLLKGISRVIRENGPYDAVHAHNYFESAISLHAAKKAGIKVRIAHSHNTSVGNTNNFIYCLYNSRYSKLIGKYSTARIGCSRGACEFLFGDADAEVVNNAIDLKKYNKDLYPERKSGTELRMMHVGRYCDQKNQSFLLDMFREYTSCFGDAHLTMIGFGSEKEDIKNKIIELGLEDRVDMLPHDSDIPRIMSENDVFVFPSKFEGLGIVLIEAQAMGMYCYASDVVPSEADLGNCTYIPLSLGASGWAEKIHEHLSSHENGRHYVDMSSYDIENVIKKYDILYSGEESPAEERCKK